MDSGKHGWRGKGVGKLLRTTITCAKCGQPATWAGSTLGDQLWERMRRCDDVEILLAKLKCKCGGQANKIEFDLAPPEMGLCDEIEPAIRRKAAQ
jgi:hypothetical protein